MWVSLPDYDKLVRNLKLKASLITHIANDTTLVLGDQGVSVTKENIGIIVGSVGHLARGNVVGCMCSKTKGS